MIRLFKHHMTSGSMYEEHDDSWLAYLTQFIDADAFANATTLSAIDVHNICGNARPMQIALGLLGYDVFAIEILRRNHTIRVDLRAPVFQPTVTSRPADDDLSVSQRVRFYVERPGGGAGATPVPIGAAEVRAYVDRFGDWLDIDTADLYAAYQSALSPVMGVPPSASLRGIVEANLLRMVESGFSQPFEIDSGLPMDGQLVGDYTDRMGAALVRLINEVIFAPVAAFLQFQLGQAADRWFRADAAAMAARKPGELPPGRLGVLDPALWRDGTRVQSVRLWPDDAKTVENGLAYLRKTFGLITKAMGKESFIGTEGAGDPPGRYTDLAGQVFYTAGLSSHRSPFLHRPLPAGAEGPVSAASVLVQRLSETWIDAEVVVFPSTTDPDDELGLLHMYASSQFRRRYARYDPNILVNKTKLTTVLTLARKLDAAQVLRAPAHRVKSAREELDTLLRLIGAGNTARAYMDERFDLEDCLLLMLMLMEFGVFSINHLLGLPEDDGDLEEPAYDIVAQTIETMPGAIRLTLPDYAHQGIVLTLEAQDLGYTLEEAVSWAYIPPPQRQPRAPDEAARQALAKSDNPKIALVAAPGVAIDRVEWPATVDMVVVRVQDIGQVPPPDAPINPLTYSATQSVGLDDLITAKMRADDPALGALYDAFANWDEKPLVLVKPVNVPASIPDRDPLNPQPPVKTGVSIAVKPPKTTDKNWPGPLSAASMTLEVDALSGVERFSYQIKPRAERQNRAAGDLISGGIGEPDEREMIPVDYLSFDVVVHSTHKLGGKAVGSGLKHMSSLSPSPILPYTLGARFYIAGSDAPNAQPDPARLRDVAPQGAALAHGAVGGTVTNSWIDYLADGRIVERQTGQPLAQTNEPFMAASQATATWVSQMIVDVGVGFIPIVGDAADIGEFMLSCYTGRDRWGQPVNNFQRMLMLGGVLLPFVSTGVLRGVKGAVSDVPDPSYLAAVKQVP